MNIKQLRVLLDQSPSDLYADRFQGITAEEFNGPEVIFEREGINTIL